MAATKGGVPVGSTWTNTGSINLDLDNLLTSKKGKGEVAPSMNQLKIQSPVKTTAPKSPVGGFMSPPGGLMSPTQPPTNIPLFGANNAFVAPQKSPFAQSNQFNAFQ
ncbi:hypothetical protein DMENIID0001_018530 [Sergentomyia squamirostris]